MFFSHFGTKGKKKFCRQPDLPGLNIDRFKLQADNWSDEICFETLINKPEIRDLVRKYAGQSKRVMSADVFLGLCDRAFSPPEGFFCEKVAAVDQSIYEKLDLAAEKFQSKLYLQPPGKVLVALLCSMAHHGDKLRKVSQFSDGCIFEASIPSDRWSFEGELLVGISRKDKGTLVEAATVLEGQWAKRKHCLSTLLADIGKIPAW